MKFRVIVSDPPWGFSDKLTMSDVKRGAASNYKTLTIKDIKNIPVEAVADDDSILCLWVPSSLLQEGMNVMSAWGFRQTQTWVWVKTKKDPFGRLLKKLLKESLLKSNMVGFVEKTIKEFDIHDVLNFGMGRLGRNVHEICLIGVKGSPYKFLKNKSQRTVFFSQPQKHSKKPENLQDMLDIMFDGKKIELFGRRLREGWEVVGNECPSSLGEDIFYSVEKYINLKT